MLWLLTLFAKFDGILFATVKVTIEKLLAYFLWTRLVDNVNGTVHCMYVCSTPNSPIALDRYNDDADVERAFLNVLRSSYAHGAVRGKARAVYSFQAQNSRLPAYSIIFTGPRLMFCA